MNFYYKPMSKEDAEKERYGMLKEGEYEATVKKAEPRISSNMNHMIQLTLDVYEGDKTHQVIDYIVFSEKMMWKCIHFCESAGIFREYEDGKFKPEMCNNKNVRVKVNIKQGNLIPEDKLQGKPIGSKYPDRNGIDDYIIKKVELKKIIENDFIDDDLPF